MDWYKEKLREYIEKNKKGDPDKYVWLIENTGKSCEAYMTKREERNSIDSLMKTILNIERVFGYPVQEFLENGKLKAEFGFTEEDFKNLPEKKCMEIFERSTTFKFGKDGYIVKILIEQSGESPVKYVKSQEYAKTIDSAFTVLRIFSLAFDLDFEELAIAGEEGLNAAFESGVMNIENAFSNCSSEEIESVFKDYITYIMGRDPGLYLRMADLSSKVDIKRYLLDDGYKDTIDGIADKVISWEEEKGVSLYECLIGVDDELSIIEDESFYSEDRPLCTKEKVN